MNIEVLRNTHRGATIYVIASGASLDHIGRGFFADKLTITVNEAFRDWPATYAFSHHHENMGEALIHENVDNVVLSEHQFGQTKFGPCKLKGDYFTYAHAEQGTPLDPVDMRPLIDESSTTLISTPCTVAEALHFAYHLGAASIVTVGVDRGALDGRWNYRGYNDRGYVPDSGLTPFSMPGGGTNPGHIHAVDVLLQHVIDVLRNIKRVSVYSLSPFVGLKQEGHRA